MSDRVIPRQPLEAERHNVCDGAWYTHLPSTPGLHYTDAEFAAAFRPAADLEELLAAVRGHITVMHEDGCRCPVCAALRKWDEQP